MVDILVWGTGINAGEFIQNIRFGEINILAFVESNVRVENKHVFGKKVISPVQIKQYQYQFIVIANVYKEEIIENNNIDMEHVLIWDTLEERMETLNRLRNCISKERVVDMYVITKPYMQYQVCNVDDTYYLFNTFDKTIPMAMLQSGHTWAKREIDWFIGWNRDAWSDKDIFLDLGANIGTTSIYVKKKISDKLKVIAFEPIPENYNVFKANCYLNGCSDIVAENIGLSDKNENLNFVMNADNFGGSSVASTFDCGIEKTCLTLDTYFEDKGLNAENVKYIWLDAEGHEANILFGAATTISVSPANLYMEYNAKDYKCRNNYEELLILLKKTYSSFICSEQTKKGEEVKRPICELDLLYSEMEGRQCNVLFLKN